MTGEEQKEGRRLKDETERERENESREREGGRKQKEGLEDDVMSVFARSAAPTSPSLLETGNTAF